MSAPEDANKPSVMLSPEEKARQARRSRAIALGIAGIVLLFYIITVFKMGPAIMKREL